MQIKHRKPFKKEEYEKRTRVNEWIRSPQIQLVDECGKNLGVVRTFEALKMAREKDLDLVEVNPKIRPVICKIMDFGKYKYEQDKKKHKQKVASKKSEIKGIRLTFKIKGQDLETRINQAKKFLEDCHQVKIEMILKGREKAHANNAKGIIENFLSSLGDDVKIIQPIQKQSGRFSMVIGKK